MSKSKKLIIYTDGGARGNPGPAAIGAVIYDEAKNKLAEISEFIGHATNNQAEYQAVLAAIKKAKALGAEEIEFYLDSELAANQLAGNFKIKSKGLASLFVQVYNQTLNFKKVNFHYIPREQNKEADRLVNQALNLNIHTS